jgi:hypothetical protein
MDKNILIVACSIFRRELEQLRTEGLLDIEVIYLDSMLHMHPQKLEKLLGETLPNYKDLKIIVLYGDCHSRIMESETKNIRKVHGINCCEIFLGTDRYFKLRKEGAFILLPEWLERWREVFQVELGFKEPQLARKFMNDFHTGMVYVKTGASEVPVETINELSSFIGLKCRIESCSAQNLLNEILLTAKKLADD